MGATIYFGIHVLIVLMYFAYFFMAHTQKDSPMPRQVISIISFGFLQALGYLMLLGSKSQGSAIASVKIQYLGTIYVSSFLMFFAIRFCRKQISTTYKGVILGVNLIQAIFILCFPQINLFIKNVNLFTHPGRTVFLDLQVGDWFYLSHLFAIAQIGYGIDVTYNNMRQEKGKRAFRKYGWLVAALSIALAGLIEESITVIQHSGYNLAPLCTGLCVSIFFIAEYKKIIYDIESIVDKSLLRNIEGAIVIADSKYAFVKTNAAAEEIFPALRHCYVGGPLPVEVSSNMWDNQGITEYKLHDQIYNVSVTDMTHNNDIVGHIMYFMNITEERRKLDEMKKLKEAADQANIAKSDFLARMSHEIRTPINSILGMNEMILRESKSREIRGYAQDVMNAGKSLLSIVNDILDSSKIESGKMQIINAKYDLSSLLNDVVNMFTVKAEEKYLKFYVEVNPELPNNLYGDDVRIKQIFVNLLGNAIKYTEKGSVTLLVDGSVNRDWVTLRVQVKDTGIGIRQEDQKKLFEAFERVDLNKNRNVEGAGLGLNITGNLLRMMNSELQLESVYGEGSNFHFELLQRISNGEKIEKIGDFRKRVEKSHKESKYRAVFRAPDAKILVVDDNAMNRSVFRNLVKQTRVQVTDVDSGMAALREVEEKHYDLIFLDHMMPEMDGVETFRRMKEMEKNQCKDTPIIMLTANAVVGAKEEYLREGFHDFLSKPIEPEKLEKMIQKYLPEELLQEADPMEVLNMNMDDADTQTVELPEIEGVDWTYGKLHLPDKELLLGTTVKFYKTIPEEKEKIAKLFTQLEDPESLNDYCIRVHAVKGLTATIGIMQLSALAKALEMAVKQNDLEKVGRLHPLFMEELEATEEKLKVLAPKEEPKKQADPMQALPMFGMLRGALDDRDYDTADELMEQILQYEYSEDLREEISDLEGLLLNLRAEEAIEVCDRIIQGIMKAMRS